MPLEGHRGHLCGAVGAIHAKQNTMGPKKSGPGSPFPYFLAMAVAGLRLLLAGNWETGGPGPDFSYLLLTAATAWARSTTRAGRSAAGTAWSGSRRHGGAEFDVTGSDHAVGTSALANGR